MQTTWTSLKTSEPPSELPIEVCAGDPFVSHVQASGVFFHWVCHPYCVVQFWLWPLRLLLCPYRKCPKCSFAICDEQRSFNFTFPLHSKVVIDAHLPWAVYAWTRVVAWFWCLRRQPMMLTMTSLRCLATTVRATMATRRCLDNATINQFNKIYLVI